MALTDNGLQQISEVYARDLRSSYANQLLYNVIEPGVYNISVTLSEDSGNLIASLSAGSVFFIKNTFKDEQSVLPELDIPMLVKAYLAEPATVNCGALSSIGATKIITAKYTWGNSQNNKYLDFYVKEKTDSLSSNEVLVCTLHPTTNLPGTLPASYLDVVCSTNTLPYANLDKEKHRSYSNFNITHNRNFTAMIALSGSAFINSTLNKITWSAETEFADVIDMTSTQLLSNYLSDQGYTWSAFPAGTTGTYVAGKVQIDVLFLKGIVQGSGDTKPSLEWSTTRYTFGNPSDAAIDFTGIQDSDYYEIAQLILAKIANIELDVSIVGKPLAIVYRMFNNNSGTESLPAPTAKSIAYIANYSDIIGTTYTAGSVFIPIDSSDAYAV